MVKLLRSLDAHTDKVWSVSAHPTLPLFATASTDKTSCVYGLNEKFPLLSRLEDAHKRSVRSVAFKPALSGSDDFLDLPALAAGSFDSTISVWGIDEPEIDFDQDQGEEDEETKAKKQQEILCSPANQWNLMAIIEGHENEVKSVAWNAGGNLLATCSRDKTVWIWETDPETLEEFECISVLNDHEHDVKHIVWHPTKNMLASSSYDDSIRIYKEDDDEWACVGALNGHTGTVWCSAFEQKSTSSKIRLVSVSDDLSVRIWSSNDTEDQTSTSNELPSSIKHDSEMVWELDTTLPAVHTHSIYSVSWSKSGRIVTVGSDGKLVIYSESDDGKWTIDAQLETIHGVYEVNCVTWATLNDGKEVILTAGDDGKVNIWEV
ncbi:cytosolic iron-sulfur protein assembly protein 1 [[Candida] anglica]|uniref:Probable cytosolic iron-sulfur protein assembly protein 1 n=1 Tax=[Candida] anglica TaxID=148631 RepID=A0ABP0E6Q6_9ASCO